jgi:cytidine deaminase
MINSHIKLRSHSPYSKTDETCLIEGTSGLIYPGVRVENISYPLTISAVQGAVCSCLANGDTPQILYQNEPFSELIGFWQNEFNFEIQNQLPDEISLFDPLLPEPGNIPETLAELCKKSVTIHSGFPVSALLVTADGWVPGVNIEVTSWSQGLCAERLAITRALAGGYQNFEQIHIFAPKSDFSSPCGACRQVLNEWMPDKMVVMHHRDQALTKHFARHLLPFGFTSGS